MPRIFTWISLLLLVCCLSCDRVGKDVAPTAEEDPVPSDNVLYTLPDASLAVNLKALADPKVPTTFRVDQLPESGKVTFTAKGFMLYTPDPLFIAGDDAFTLKSDAPAVPGKPQLPINFAVSVVSNPDQIPCGMSRPTEPVETDENTPVTIEVVRPGLFCDQQANPASIEIQSQPRAGSVRVQGGKIIYTPLRNVSGRDVFVYQICPTGGSADDCIMSTATVNVNDVVSTTACRVHLNDDRISYRPRFVTDSIVIPVLANDQLCQASRVLPLSLTVAPSGGAAYLTPQNWMVYKPRLTTINDRVHYRRCEKGDCLDAYVLINIKQPEPGCVLKANADLTQLILSKPGPFMKIGTIPISVLANDHLCAPLQSVRVIRNPNNATLRVNSIGTIEYKMDVAPKPKEITFVYELTDAQGKTTSATVRISIKP